MPQNKRTSSELLTVMFIDIVGYTTKTSTLSRDKLDLLQETFDSLSLPVFEHYGGNIIKKSGDAFLATFTSATDAVLCGIGLQKAFKKHNKRQPEKDRIIIRVALHTGEVLKRKGDIYGDTVNITARVEGIAKAHDIVLSKATFDALNKNEVRVMTIGEHKLKGVRRPMRLFKVIRGRKKRRFWLKVAKNLKYYISRVVQLISLALIIWAIIYLLRRIL